MITTKSTGELMDELMQSNDLDKYFKENADCLMADNLSVYLSTILENKGLVKSAVVKNTELSEVHGYQVFSGTRKPSRDALVCVCVAMGLNVEQTQAVLKIGGFARLYPKSKRDSILIIGIKNGLTVAKINEQLFDNGEETLSR